MKCNMLILKRAKIFSFIISISLISVYASESNIPKFSEFADLTPEFYIAKALPQNQSDKIINIFTRISQLGTTPIQEDDGQMSLSEPQKIIQESGYSFPPKPTIQGPFLYLCGQPKIQNIIDLGSGNGADTVMALATGKQIISIDIHQNQIDKLTETVRHIFSDNQIILSKFKPFKYNFAKKNVPEKWKNGFNLINVNKVFHFLNDQETKNMVKNVYTLTKPEGYVCITVATPVTGSFESAEFDKQKKLNNATPGLVFYDTLRSLPNLGFITKKIVSHEQMQCENPNFISPGQKREFIANDNNMLVLRQGRHFHTLETLMPYLQDFTLLDSHKTEYDADDWFLSILLQKPRDTTQ